MEKQIREINMTIARIDFYTEAHKMFREQLFNISTHAGKVDYKNAQAVSAFNSQFNDLLAALEKHAYHEETFLHPLIAAKIPGSEEMLDAEHVEQAHTLTQLLNHFNRLYSLPLDHEKRNTMGLEFYRAFNRFIRDYLDHLDKEECLMPVLWELCTPSELMSVWIAFNIYFDEVGGKECLTKILPNATQQERREILIAIQTYAPQEIYQKAFEFCQHILPERHWKELKST